MILIQKLACVTTQSQVPLPLIFLSCYTFTVLPALSWLSHFLTLWPPHLEQSPPRHQALCYSLFFQKPTQDISLLRIFPLNHIVLHSYQSVQCVCVHACTRAFMHVCVCIFCIIMLEHLSIYIIYTYFFG